MRSILTKLAIAAGVLVSVTYGEGIPGIVINQKLYAQTSQNFTHQLRKAESLVDSTEDNVKLAHTAYKDALVEFYKALPRNDGAQYYIVLEALAMELNLNYKDWLKKTGKELNYMDSYSFEKYYQQEKLKSKVHGSHQSGWTRLEKLRRIGQTLDLKIQQSVENLAKLELTRSKEYYTDCALAAQQSHKFLGWDRYELMVKEHNVPVDKFANAVNEVAQAKQDYQNFMQTTDGLKQFAEDKDFNAHYLRGISANMGIPKASVVKEEIDMYPDNELIKKAYEYIKNINETDRLKFNYLFKTALNKARVWSEAARELDDSLLQLSAFINDKIADKEIIKANDYVVEAINHRQQLNKVWQALQVVNQRTQISQYHSSLYQKEIEVQAEYAFQFKLILNLVLVVGGLIFCNVAKKRFFAGEEQEFMEGGQPEPKIESASSSILRITKRNSNSYQRIQGQSIIQDQETSCSEEQV